MREPRGDGGLGEPLLPPASPSAGGGQAPPAGAFPSRPWWMSPEGSDGDGGELDDDNDGASGGTEERGGEHAAEVPTPSATAPSATRRRRRRVSSSAPPVDVDVLPPSSSSAPSRSSSESTGDLGGGRRQRLGAGSGGRILDRSGRFHQSRGRWSISNSRRVDSETALAMATGGGGRNGDGRNVDGGSNGHGAHGHGHQGRADEEEDDAGRGHNRRRRSSVLSRVRTNPRGARSYVRGGPCDPRRCWEDWFHTLAHTPTFCLMLIMFTFYTLTIFWFAFLYYFVSREFAASELLPASVGASGALGLRGVVAGGGSNSTNHTNSTSAAVALASSSAWGGVGLSDGSFCGMDITTPTEALYFSLSTMTTIGYGVSDYYFGDCLTPFVLVLLQVFTAIAFDAVAIGLLFTRMSRGQKRGRTIIFSDSSAVRRVRGRLYWMCRVGELRRKHHIVDARVRAYCVRHERHPDPWRRTDARYDGNTGARAEDPWANGGIDTGPVPIETTHYQTRPLRLVSPDDEIGSNVLMSLPGMIVHRLDGDGRGRSPLVPPSPVWYDREGLGHLWPLPPSPPPSPRAGRSDAARTEDDARGHRTATAASGGTIAAGERGVEPVATVGVRCVSAVELAAGVRSVGAAVAAAERLGSSSAAAGEEEYESEDLLTLSSKTPKISNRRCPAAPPPPKLDAAPAAGTDEEASSAVKTAAKASAMGASAIAGGILGTIFAGPIVAGVAGVAAATAVGGAMAGGKASAAEGAGKGVAANVIDDEEEEALIEGGGAGEDGRGDVDVENGGGVLVSEPLLANGHGPGPGIGGEYREHDNAETATAEDISELFDAPAPSAAPTYPPLSADQHSISAFLRDRDAEIIVLIEGIDEMTGGAVQARHSYAYEDVVWNGTFGPCVFPSGGEEGRRRGRGRRRPACVVDFSRFHDVRPAPEDCASCPLVPDWA